jgi:ketosteroid isomerase-like protein
MSTAKRITDALERRDLEGFIREFDSHAVWLGRQPDGSALDCRNRDEIKSVFDDQIALGRSGRPEIVAETDDQIVVDMHPDPPEDAWPELHHVLTVRAGKVVRMEDFIDRASAIAALEPS